MTKDFANSSFRLTRYPGVLITDPEISRKDRGYIGVARTHIEIVKMCKAKGQKTVLILEDDCKPEPNWEKNWYKIRDYLDSNLDKWEVFNGAICGIEKMNRVVVLDDIYLLNTVGGCFSHWLYLNVDAAYDKLLAWEDVPAKLALPNQSSALIENNKKEIDLYYTYNFNHYTTYPLLAEQYSGYSDIGEREKDWSVNFMMARLDIRKNLLGLGLLI
jgi:hypothetical protein